MPADPGPSGEIVSLLQELLDFERANSTLDRETLCKRFSKERGELCQRTLAAFQPLVLISPPRLPAPLHKPSFINL